jgi:hypothetical protein
MTSYGTKEYWEDVRDRHALVLESLMCTGFDSNVPYKKVSDFCNAFLENYSDYTNAIVHLNELEAKNVDNGDA